MGHIESPFHAVFDFFSIVYYICPVVSLFVGAMTYTAAFGIELNIVTIVCLLFSLMLILIGNYLPKCKQNHTIGIKVPWTLNSEENWNKTHRVTGILWVISGVLMIPCAFLPMPSFPYIFTIVMIVTVAFPIIYSYVYYKKHEKK